MSLYALIDQYTLIKQSLILHRKKFGGRLAMCVPEGNSSFYRLFKYHRLSLAVTKATENIAPILKSSKWFPIGLHKVDTRIAL